MGLNWLLGKESKPRVDAYTLEQLRHGAEIDWLLERMQAQTLYLHALGEAETVDEALETIQEDRETFLSKLPDGHNLAPFAVIIDYLFMRSLLKKFGYYDGESGKEALRLYRNLPAEQKPPYRKYGKGLYEADVKIAREYNEYEIPMNETAYWLSMLLKRFGFKEQYFGKDRRDQHLNKMLFGVDAIANQRQAEAFFDKLEGIIGFWTGKLSEPGIFALYDEATTIRTPDSQFYIEKTVGQYHWLVEKIWDEHRDNDQPYWRDPEQA